MFQRIPRTGPDTFVASDQADSNSVQRACEIELAMGFDDWNSEVEGAADTDLAFHPDRSSLEFDQLLCDSKP
jgi:hypothetical protein